MRRLSREITLQVLFQSEFAPSLSVFELFQSLENEEADLESKKFAQSLLEGVSQNKAAIDAKIQAASQHWKLERMASVDRNILRLAVYEIEFSREPLKPAIVINEAIELAKKFGTADSASFVNGVLDQIRKGL